MGEMASPSKYSYLHNNNYQFSHELTPACETVRRVAAVSLCCLPPIRGEPNKHHGKSRWSKPSWIRPRRMWGTGKLSVILLKVTKRWQRGSMAAWKQAICRGNDCGSCLSFLFVWPEDMKRMIIIEEGERCGDKENKQQGATTWETDNCDSQWRRKGETTDSPIQLNFAKQKWQPNHLIIALKSFGVTHLPLLV